MSDTGRRSLIQALHADPPPALTEAVADDDLGRLAAAIEAARGRQRDALTQAGEHALAVLPRPLRGPVRRIAGG